MNHAHLIVDDEPPSVSSCETRSSHAGFDAQSVQNPGRRRWRSLATRPFDVVVTDLNMPGMTGIELCRRIVEAAPHMPVVLITAFGSIETAVAAIRAGAYDFVTKPFEIDALALALRRARRAPRAAREVDALRRVVDTSQRFGGLLGTSPAMREVYGIIERVADTDAPVLITGESGTGKELVARALHARSRARRAASSRSTAPRCPRRCSRASCSATSAARSPTRARRATGLLRGGQRRHAVPRRDRRDAASACSPSCCARCRSARCGPSARPHEVPFDARIIAATNRDLESAVEDGRFREDLYYRINVIHIALPPLRARGGDVLPLAQHFLGEAAARNGKPVPTLTSPAAERLLAYDWPGNVRELRNCIERAVALARSERIDVEDLPPQGARLPLGARARGG